MKTGANRQLETSGNDPILLDCIQSVLARYGGKGWQIQPDYFWCYVRPPNGRSRVQGWKLHLSATPLAAPLVLARSAEVLVRRECAFKFAGTLDRVEALVSHRYDRGAGGKFITAYPDGDDDLLRALAEELHKATEGMPGPGVLSDRSYRPGSLVHYRFGAFGGMSMLGNDGSREAMLVAPDGTLVLDKRKAWFTPPQWAPPDPFAPAQVSPPTATDDTTPKPVLLDGRYVVREAIRHAFKGGVFRATDQQTGASVIIKQARPHVGANLTGRDVRDSLRHEAAMLELFASSEATPRLVALFEQQDDLFLAQEAVTGVTLREWVQEHIEFGEDERWGPPQTAVARIAQRLVDLVDLVHAQGLVLLDFGPNNVMVTDDGDLRLIDLEFLAKPGQPVLRAFTPGYGAPEQVGRSGYGPAPEQTADLYGLGATLFYLATGVDPLLARDEPKVRTDRERIETWLAHLSIGNPCAGHLAPIILALVHRDPAQRPDLDAVRQFLAGRGEQAATFDVRVAASSVNDPEDDTDRKELLADGIEYLIATMDPDNPEHLWPSREPGRRGEPFTTDPFNVQHGAAGVLGVLTRAYQSEPDPTLRQAVATTAEWIRRRVLREPRMLPGLYFGRSGTAWALLESGRLLGDEKSMRLAADLARRVPLRWPNPDVCHGTAGAGLTQLRFWEVTGEDVFLVRARQAAEAMVAAAERRDGHVLWPIARDFASNLAGVVHYGFAHGVAGAGAFLLAAGRATGESVYLDLAAQAADTLVSVAHVEGGAAYWSSGAGYPRRLVHWCSGSSGVATFLVRMWQERGDDRLLQLAAQAAVAIRRSRWHAGTPQCHGLAGDAELLLDLAEVSGQDRYRRWATGVATAIHLRHARRDGRKVITDEDDTTVSAAFNTGLAGVVALLLRLRDGGPRLWLPEILTRPTTAL